MSKFAMVAGVLLVLAAAVFGIVLDAVPVAARLQRCEAKCPVPQCPLYCLRTLGHSGSHHCSNYHFFK